MIREDYVVTYEYVNERTKAKKTYITITKAHNKLEAIKNATDYASPYIKTKVLKCERWQDILDRHNADNLLREENQDYDV